MHHTQGIHRPTVRRGGADLKTILAVLFAVGGLSWGAIALLSGRGDSGGKDADKPRVVASALDEQGRAVEPVYTSTRGEKGLGEARMQIDNIVSAEAMGALGEIAGPKGSVQGVSDAVVGAFVPIVGGDYDAFLSAIVAMGGKIPGDLDGEHPMFTHLKKEFAGAKIDLSRITVRRYEATLPGRGGTRMTRDVQDRGDGGPALQTSRMDMRPESVFPDAPDAGDASAIEVLIPVLPKGEDLESIFGLVLTWNSAAGLWQPATYSVIKNRLVEGEG